MVRVEELVAVVVWTVSSMRYTINDTGGVVGAVARTGIRTHIRSNEGANRDECTGNNSDLSLASDCVSVLKMNVLIASPVGPVVHQEFRVKVRDRSVMQDGGWERKHAHAVV